MDRRKELQNEYAMQKREMGVFAITNRLSGKRYIAYSTTLDSAEKRERFMLNFGSHRNSALQAEWKRDGEAQFEFEILETLKLGDEVRKDYKDIGLQNEGGLRSNVILSYRDNLKKMERKWLEKLQPFEPAGYNKHPKR